MNRITRPIGLVIVATLTMNMVLELLCKNLISITYSNAFLGDIGKRWFFVIEPSDSGPEDALTAAKYKLLFQNDVPLGYPTIRYPPSEGVPDMIHRWQWGLLAERDQKLDLAANYWQADPLQVYLARQLWYSAKIGVSQRNHARLTMLSSMPNLAPETCYFIGRAFIELTDFVSAARFLACATSESGQYSIYTPDNYSLANAFLYYGDVLLQLEQFDDAYSAYSQVVMLEPENDRGWRSMAWADYQRTKRLEPALSEYLQALSIKPVAENYFAIAQLHRLTGNYLEALKYADLGEQAGALSSAALERARIYLDMGLPELALRSCEEAIGYGSQKRDTYVVMGDTFLQLNRPKDAIYAYRQALSMDNQSLSILLRIAHAYILVDDKKSALEVLHVAETLEPDNESVIRMIFQLTGDKP